MRAHFNYDSHRDDEIPCKGLGIAFQKGDILEIVNQDDPNWWQVGVATYYNMPSFYCLLSLSLYVGL